MPSALAVHEIKAFVPSRDHERAKRFYRDLGFTLAAEGGGVAHFRHGGCSFLLQDFHAPGLVENFMMHLLVPDVDAWHRHALATVVPAYGVRITDVELQPWGLRDFCLFDPSGVLWRIGQKVD